MARTPTPSSMLALPSLTMPSSSARDSSRGALEIQVGGIDGVVHDQPSSAIEAAVVEAARGEGWSAVRRQDCPNFAHARILLQ